jgi:S1-C subfamily serine protease
MSTNPLDSNPLAALSDALADAAEAAGACVATVEARRRIPASGLLFSTEHVLTADHVVEREEEIRVFLPDGSQVGATLAGRDPGTDLALLRLDSPAVQPARVTPREPRVGQLVLALGRPLPGTLQASLGVVRSVGGPVRTGRGGLLERYLETDAVAYPGFSGGPLVDTAGRVVGINTSGLAQGVSITVPIQLAWSVAEILLTEGRVRRGYLGIRSQPVALPQAQQQALGRAQTTGLLVVHLEKNSPSERDGLLVGDILVGLAGMPVADSDELAAALSGPVVGQPAPVEVIRGGNVTTITVTIGERE